MSLDESTRERIASLIESNDVLLFMKGERDAPQCGFSATLVRILDQLVPDYATFDVLSDPAVREGVKVFSQWPTIPQLYVRGEFLGGCDIVQEIFASGELHAKLGVEGAETKAPRIAVTEAAAAALRDAGAGQPDQALHLGVDARHRASLYVGPVEAGEIEVDAGGIAVWLNPLSAGRADGVRIDVVQTDQGPGFHVDNPNAPRAVQQLPVADLRQWIDSGERFEFLDVRTPEERATAHIPGARLLTPEEAKRLESLPRDARLVFHCHHGGRSQAAAEHFAALGFTDVWNVVGGIDAWSQQVDPSVPRY